MSSEQLLCHKCNEVIGVYEPLIMLLDGQVVETSRANTDGTRHQRGISYHGSCFALGNGGDSDVG